MSACCICAPQRPSNACPLPCLCCGAALHLILCQPTLVLVPFVARARAFRLLLCLCVRLFTLHLPLHLFVFVHALAVNLYYLLSLLCAGVHCVRRVLRHDVYSCHHCFPHSPQSLDFPDNLTTPCRRFVQISTTSTRSVSLPVLFVNHATCVQIDVQYAVYANAV